MDMKDRLSGASPVVLHQAEAGLGIALLAGNFARFSEDAADQGIILHGHIEAVDKMPFRQQEQVQRRSAKMSTSSFV